MREDKAGKVTVENRKMRQIILEIITTQEGGSDTFSARGTYERTGRIEKVCYPVEQDEGELRFSKDSFEMHRKGDLGISALFCKDRETEFVIHSGVLTGSIPVKTTRYLLQEDHSGRNIELCYELLGETVQTYSLKIRILFSEEK